MIPIAKPTIGSDEMDAVRRVMATGQLAAGPEVDAFETEFAAAAGAAHAVATTNGTTALHAALDALGVGPGDEVIVPGFTFIATANAVLYAGARPVLVDVDPSTFTLDPDNLERARTERTRCVLPVHLYGQAADMDAIMKFADEHGLAVLGDAAQAIGAETGGRRVGGIAHAETFSLYPTKNITSGEGGMVTTNDEALAASLRSIVNHGRAQSQLGSYDHLRRGHNFRLSDIHAAIGRVQLARLSQVNGRRRAIAKQYDRAFASLRTIQRPEVAIGNVHVYHQYTLRCRDRAAVIDHLESRGVATGVYYPRPLHGYPHLAELAHSRLDNSTRLAAGVVSIPVHPALTDQDVGTVISAVVEADEQATTRDR